MWILNSISDIQFKRPFLILWITLGAALLLLATFFSSNGLYHPATFSALALTIWLLWQKERTHRNAMMAPGLTFASFLLFPHYLLLFCLLFTLAIGKVVFAENFRFWKWLAASGLLLLTFPIVDSWQGIPEFHKMLPAPLTHLIHAAVMAFCVQFSLLPFQIRKDSVVEAFDHYAWKTPGDPYRLASECVALHTKIKTNMKTKEATIRIQQDLEDYTERVLHQCYRLQEISTEIASVPLGSLEQQISFLKNKLRLVDDFTTRMQYEQALSNKEKQLEHYESLRLQQERLLSQIINFNSSLENIRFAYANQDWQKSAGSTENIEMFMDLVKARAEAL